MEIPRKLTLERFIEEARLDDAVVFIAGKLFYPGR